MIHNTLTFKHLHHLTDEHDEHHRANPPGCCAITLFLMPLIPLAAYYTCDSIQKIRCTGVVTPDHRIALFDARVAIIQIILQYLHHGFE